MSHNEANCLYLVVSDDLRETVKKMEYTTDKASRTLLVSAYAKSGEITDNQYIQLGVCYMNLTGQEIVVPKNLEKRFENWKAEASLVGKQLCAQAQMEGTEPALMKLEQGVFHKYLCVYLRKMKELLKSRTTTIRILEKLNGNVSPAKEFEGMMKAISTEEETTVKNKKWVIDEITKKMNLLTVVTKNPTKNPILRKCFEDIIECTTNLQGLLGSLEGASASYEPMDIYVGWLKSVRVILNKPDYLESQGIYYEILKGVSDDLVRIYNSILD